MQAPTDLRQRYARAENDRVEAARLLNTLVKQIAMAFADYDAKKRLAKRLKEQLRKELQRPDR